MMNRQHCADQEFARTILYQFLAMTFYEPADNFLVELEQEDSKKDLLEASRLLLEVKGVELMQEILHTLDGVNNAGKLGHQDLKAEYTRLFLGPMSPACPPYESYFDTNRPQEFQGTLMGPSSEAMEIALAEEGLELTLDYAELSDHVAIELEFMYYLLSRAYAEEKDSDVYLKKANAFFMEHLFPWLPKFGAKLSKESRHPFYKGIGLLLESTVKIDLGSVVNQKH
ncbi:putative component of anaerobic dehydrogenase [Desulfitobacterium dichloroeliminans LMG P-21439]|uniref:Putative component of anaerobic dehydrogenase n=1 Tax=Desulfitobacterium dichloroeliminans (strain LMG P-21439 / DCA1) TaxID=871963 RepID=L0F929_DESDL|nr:molecular chaperone TorD family protein [Desulfitobacterium dichloroeliminans]AGA69156.1 putative component of anaerobic dehydrogenase [Desulfitobacterium dichloroeliminans LMG P-21439]